MTFPRNVATLILGDPSDNSLEFRPNQVPIGVDVAKRAMA